MERMEKILDVGGNRSTRRKPARASMDWEPYSHTTHLARLEIQHGPHGPFICFCFNGCITKMHQPRSELRQSRCKLRQSRPHLMHIQNSYVITHWSNIDLWPHAYSVWPLTSHPSRDLMSRCCKFATQLKQFATIDEIRGSIDAIRDNNNIDFKYWPGWVE